MSASIYGGSGGASGGRGGKAGLGGAGIVGANLTIINSGSITGGMSGATTNAVQADAIDYTGGTNSLTLSQNGTTGTLSGGIGVAGTLSINPGTAARVAATLGNTIHDYIDPTTGDPTTGSLTKVDAGTLDLSGQNTYSGGTTLAAGTLDLAGATTLDATGTAIVSAAAGTGAITFGAGANATLRIENSALSSTGAATARFANTVASFAAGDTMDVRGVGATVASFDYSTDVLTLTGATTTTLQLSGNYVGEVFTATPDGSTGSNVTLTNVTQPAPTIALADDTGTSNTDAITSNPTVTGKDDIGALVTIKDASGNTLDSFTATTATYSFTPTTLAQGLNTLTISETRAGETASASMSFTLDTTPPAASSPTDTVAQNSAAMPIGIAAPSDNLTAAGSLAIAAGALPTDGTVTLADGTAVAAGQALTAAQLTGLLFTPTPGISNQGSTFTYTVTDGAGNASTGTAALNVGAAGAPTVTGTHATTDGSEAAVTPFAGVTLSDPNMGTNTLTITLQNGGGTLTGTGLVANPNGIYTLAGSAATVTQQLDALSFTPTAPPPGTSATTTFVLSDVTSAGTSVTDVGTTVTDTASAPPPPPLDPTPDAVSLDQMVSYRRGVFTLTGSASSAAGVQGVEISAVLNDGTRQDLGAATVNADGTFTFADKIGANQQGFIIATETNNAGGTAAGQASYSLTGGLSGGRGEQNRYTADGSAEAATDVFKGNGSQRANLFQPEQTFASSFFDKFENNGAPSSTFVFNPGFGRDVVDLFRVDGNDHDTLSFKGSDYGNSIAAVLNASRDTAAGLLITDPTASSPGGGPGTHDTLLLKGITKQQLAANQGDIAFHA